MTNYPVLQTDAHVEPPEASSPRLKRLQHNLQFNPTYTRAYFGRKPIRVPALKSSDLVSGDTIPWVSIKILLTKRMRENVLM